MLTIAVLALLGAVLLAGLPGLPGLLQAAQARAARREQRRLMARARWLAELWLQLVTHDAMRQLLDEARRSR